jgi:hypothetical protein
MLLALPYLLRSLLALCLVVLAGGTSEAKMRVGCPFTTSVEPFGAFSFGLYTIRMMDGGTGDEDGVANGSCSFHVRTCLGGSIGLPESCLGEPIGRLDVLVHREPRISEDIEGPSVFRKVLSSTDCA